MASTLNRTLLNAPTHTLNNNNTPHDSPAHSPLRSFVALRENPGSLGRHSMFYYFQSPKHMWCLLVSFPPTMTSYLHSFPVRERACVCMWVVFPLQHLSFPTPASHRVDQPLRELQSNRRTSPGYLANSDGDTAKRSLLTAHYSFCVMNDNSHSVLIIVPCASEQMPFPTASTCVLQSVQSLDICGD